MEFKQFIEESAARHKSPIVLSLDVTRRDRDDLFKTSLKMIRSLSSWICALKINRQLILPLGLHDRVATLVKEAHKYEIPSIMDAKINDIGHTNEFTASEYFSAGFDAVTANPFVGYKDGLEPVFRLAKSEQKGVLLLVHMSHKGATEGYGQTVIDVTTGQARPQFEIFADRALQWHADGAIVGATFTEMISKVYAVLGRHVPIYSPGIGVQGGNLRDALNAGAKYVIVGRSIYESEDPAQSAEDLRATVTSSG